MFGAKGLAYATAALTAITLFFGELLPKVTHHYVAHLADFFLHNAYSGLRIPHSTCSQFVCLCVIQQHEFVHVYVHTAR
jgi:Mg2+/Co2+ transporter CorB